MMTKLFNPFKYIAGGKSLVIGVFILVLTAVIGFFSNTHFPDVISVKIGVNFPVQYYIIQVFANWIVVSIILYLISLIISKSKVRILDVFGTQALARFPYLIASFVGFSNSMDRVSKYMLWEFLQQGEAIELSVTTVVMAILLIVGTLVLTIWLVGLMYNAFKVSANLKGSKSVLLFIAGLIVSIILSGLISNQLIKYFIL